MPISAELLAELEDHDDPDAMVLLQMAQIGADLQKPHSPDFTFEVEDEPAALALAAELAALDYSVRLYAPDRENPGYQVIAQRTMILELSTLMSLSQAFEALAARHGAVYDGWGAEIVE
jgi:Regulator of ribonuclease activity B